MISNVMSPSQIALKPRLFLGIVFGALLNLTGCASAPNAYRTGEHWSKDGYAWPSGGVAKTKTENGQAMLASSGAVQEPNLGGKRTPAEPTATFPRIAPPPPVRALRLSGSECEDELKRRGIRFRGLSELKGVENPVEVKSKLGGVSFWANDGRPLQLDCRLAIALDQLAPVFQSHGVRKIRYSGAYSYRSTKNGRLSHHAHGLAIDLHDFDLTSGSFSISSGFQKNVGCQEGISALNALSCEMRDQALFEEFLTPDYNYDHRDHLHISVPRFTP